LIPFRQFSHAYLVRCGESKCQNITGEILRHCLAIGENTTKDAEFGCCRLKKKAATIVIPPTLRLYQPIYLFTSHGGNPSIDHFDGHLASIGRRSRAAAPLFDRESLSAYSAAGYFDRLGGTQCDARQNRASRFLAELVEIDVLWRRPTIESSQCPARGATHRGWPEGHARKCTDQGVVTGSFTPRFVALGNDLFAYPADVDGDGDVDVLSASHREWFENLDGKGSFVPRVIENKRPADHVTCRHDISGLRIIETESPMLNLWKICHWRLIRFVRSWTNRLRRALS
jgi:hypothetical protein